MRRVERTGGPAPKRSRMSLEVLKSNIHNICFLACCSIKTHTSSQKELFPTYSVSAMQLAPPQSSAEPPPTQRIVADHLPAHPSTKLLKPLYQSLKAWEVIPGFSDVVPALMLERCALFSPHSDIASALMLGLWVLTSLFVFIKDYNNF